MKILIITLLSSLSLVLNAQEKYSTHEMDSLVQAAGTQSTYAVSTDNKIIIYLWPVKTPEELDLLRNSVGLPSVNEYIKDLESTSGTQVIYDSTLTVKQIKRMIKDNRIISD